MELYISIVTFAARGRLKLMKVEGLNGFG